MKKLLALALVVFGLAACQTEPEGINVDANGEAAVTLNVALPDDATRAAGTDSAKGAIGNVDMSKYDIRYILEVYDEDGRLAKERMVETSDETTATFSFRLVPGRPYNFVVWADFVLNGKKDDLHYNTNEGNGGLRKVEVIKTQWDVIDESRDAYTDVVTVHNFSSAADIPTITLTRPFAKLRVVTNDITEMISIRPAEVKVTYFNTKFYDTFDAFAETASGEYTGHALTATLLDSQQNPVDVYSGGLDAEDGVQTLFADYFFGAEDDRVMFTMDVKDNGGRDLPQVTFNTNIPVKRNNLTTVYGPVLTDSNNITVTIDDAFENGTEWNPGDDKYDVAVWDGKSLTEPKKDTEGNYVVELPSELAWLAAAVNGTLETRATVAPRTFKGETFKLAQDIDLGSESWTPIGTTGVFSGTFDGQNHTINNLVVSTTEGDAVGLFGDIYGGVVKNVTVKNATITGHTKIAVVVGCNTCGTVQNCHVEGAIVTATTLKDDGGNHVGAIVGYLTADSGNASVTECTVKDVEVSAFRDVAAVVGTATGNSKPAIKKCSAEKATITADQLPVYSEGDKDGNAGVIVGRQASVTVIEDCIEGENNVVIRKVDSDKELQYALADAKSGDTIYVAAGEYAALTGVKDGVIIEATGAVFTGVSNATGDGAKVIGATFKNEFVSEKYCFTGSMTNTTFENCVFEAYSSARWCYAHGEVVFNNCKFGTENSWRGIHFDSGEGKVTFNNCDLYGFQAFGGSLEKVTFNECNFFKGRSTNVVNMYGVFEYNDCKFVAGYNCDCAGDGVVAAFNGCSYVDGTDITKIVRFDKDSKTCTITFDGKKYENAGLLKDAEGNYHVSSASAIKTAVKEKNATVYVYPDAEDGVYDIESKLSLAEGVRLIGVGEEPVKITNTWSSNLFANQAYFTDTYMENICADNNLVIDAGIANGNVVFKKCIFGGDRAHQGVHFDSGNGTITFEECTFIGRNMLGSSIEKVTFNKCFFENKRSSLTGADKWTGVNMWGKYEFNECTFDTEAHCSVKCDGVVAAFNDCSFVDARDITSVVNYDGEFDAQITFDGNKYIAEGKLEDAEGNTIATSVAGLRDALKEGEDVILAGDMAVKSSESESNGYGKTGINMTNGGTIDGGGNDISINAWSTWDSAINTTGGTIKNINVTGGMRGIFVNHNSDNCSKVYLENVVVDGTVYTISCDQGTNKGLEAINSTFNGWTSYAATIGDVKFTNCNFGEGQGYAYCRPYAPTEFIGCEFEAGFTLEPCAAVTFESCTLNGVALTDANLGELVTDTANVTIK